MHTRAEENYLKAIYHLSGGCEVVSTTSIAAVLHMKAASVTDMLKKLADKQLIDYRRYQGVKLTPGGKLLALRIIRRHRIWEFFLVEKLQFGWDQVHEMAEQLEHIGSEELVDRLDDFIGNPSYDPHGDPIPDRQGNLTAATLKPVSTLAVNKNGVISGVRDHSSVFFAYLREIKLGMGQTVTMEEINAYDRSVKLRVGDECVQISRQAAENLLVTYE